jgi:hypothetical protein
VSTYEGQQSSAVVSGPTAMKLGDGNMGAEERKVVTTVQPEGQIAGLSR